MKKLGRNNLGRNLHSETKKHKEWEVKVSKITNCRTKSNTISKIKEKCAHEKKIFQDGTIIFQIFSLFPARQLSRLQINNWPTILLETEYFSFEKKQVLLRSDAES